MNLSSALKSYLNEYSAVIITGGSSGIGRAFLDVINSANCGIDIYNISRTPLSDSLASNSVIFSDPCDILNPQDFSSTIDKICEILSQKKYGKKILLINNAGISSYGNLASTPSDISLNILNLNICALVKLTHALLPFIIDSKGSIINLASTASFQPTPVLAVYGASKSFVLNFSIALNAEIAHQGCKCLALCPGPTDTKFFQRANFDANDLPDKLGPLPNEVAIAALEALRKNKAFKIVGFINNILISFSRLVPLSMSGKIAYKVMLRSKKKNSV